MAVSNLIYRLSDLKIPGGPKMACAALTTDGQCAVMNVAAKRGDTCLLFGS